MDYIMHYMPLLAFNEQHGYPTDHQWFQQWESKGDRVIRYFVEPVVLSTNYAKSLGCASDQELNAHLLVDSACACVRCMVLCRLQAIVGQSLPTLIAMLFPNTFYLASKHL